MFLLLLPAAGGTPSRFACTVRRISPFILENASDGVIPMRNITTNGMVMTISTMEPGRRSPIYKASPASRRSRRRTQTRRRCGTAFRDRQSYASSGSADADMDERRQQQHEQCGHGNGRQPCARGSSAATRLPS